MHRPGARRRYLTAFVAIALVAALPAIVGAVPVSARNIPVATLLAQVKASGNIPYTGLASSSGALDIPDFGFGTDVTQLLSNTNRLRVWWATPTNYRVDRVTAFAESDVYVTGNQLWTWDSDHRVAVLYGGKPETPLPGPQDALPPNLARRLLELAKPADLHPAKARRIAGRTVLAMTWRPNDSDSTIDWVQVWVDQDTGLPLSVAVHAKGGGRAFSSSFLDVHFAAPDPSALRFDPHLDPTATKDTTESQGPDAQPAPYRLPSKFIAGLPLRSQPNPLVATVGKGASIVAVVPIDPSTAAALRGQVDSPGHPPIKGDFGEGSLIQTPLLTGLIFDTSSVGYMLLGTVTRDQIEAMALDLVKHPAFQNAG
jgi:hypothetical protein